MRRSRISAGLLMYRLRDGTLEVFIAHPGGPWFPHRDHGIWTIPKGEIEPGEEPFEAACREFVEEVGIPSGGPYIELGSIKQKGGKTVHAWAFPGDWDETAGIRSNHVNIEWPPGSGRWSEWPEIDRAGFFSVQAAKDRLKQAQHPFIDRLISALETSVIANPDGRSGQE
jgi:predicted NUDIX family NTP pyrophosphohydrolase